MNTKVCFTCKGEFPATKEYFNSDRTKRDGLNSNCKECRAKKRNKTSAIHSEVKNGKKLCVKCKKWLDADLKHFHRDKRGKGGLVAVCKKCRGYEYGIQRLNKVIKIDGYKFCNGCKKRFNIENVVRRSKNLYLCVDCDRQRSIRQAHLRRENKRLTPKEFVLTTEQWVNCKKEFNNNCAYCGKKRKLTQDHFIPLSKNGEYSINNIIPVCSSCNSSKLDNNFFEWYPKQPFYSKSREKRILNYLNYNENLNQQLSIL